MPDTGAEQVGIEFQYFPIRAENKTEQEAKEIGLLKEHKVDFMVLVIPAIDIQGGKCVRLTKGQLNEKTVYYEDPLEALAYWEKEQGITNPVFSALVSLSRCDEN